MKQFKILSAFRHVYICLVKKGSCIFFKYSTQLPFFLLHVNFVSIKPLNKFGFSFFAAVYKRKKTFTVPLKGTQQQSTSVNLMAKVNSKLFLKEISKTDKSNY